MALTTIALHVEPGALDVVNVDLALPVAITETHGAHVTALVFPTGTTGEISGGANQGVPAHDGPVALQDAVTAHVRNILEARGLRFEVRGRSSFAYGVGEVFADQMRVSDIGIMTFGPGSGSGHRFLASGSVFSSGRPLLLLPPGKAEIAPPSFTRILLAWDATPAAVRAAHGALPFFKRAQSVTVVSVTDDKAFRPGQSGVELVHLLARHGAHAEFRQVERRHVSVGRALLDVARDVGANMMVMGAVRHAPLHNLVFGSATMDLFDQSPVLPTLVAA